MKYILDHKPLYYLIQFTWNLPMNIIGIIIIGFLFAIGYTPKKYGNAIYIEVGRYWGGLELGTFFIVNENPTDHLLMHEYGHCIDGLIKGPYMVINGLLSALRYWAREIHKKKGSQYDDFNLERRASFFGHKYMGEYNISAVLYMKSGEIKICNLTAEFGKGNEPVSKKAVYERFNIKKSDVKIFRMDYTV